MTRQEQIQSYLDMGWSLLRITPGTKRPEEGLNWQRWCTERRNLTPEYFDGYGVGVALGPSSGICAVDIDDDDGFNAFLIGQHRDVPRTRTHSGRPERRTHIYRYPDNGKRYDIKMFDEWGFELRGIGGQCVLPPSIHPETGEPYTVVDDAPVADLPAWLLELWEKAMVRVSDSEAAADLKRMGEGFRHLPIRTATAKFAARGLGFDLADEVMRYYALGHGMDEKQYENLISGAYNKFGHENSNLAEPLWSHKDVLARVDMKPEWIIEPLFCARDIVFIQADSGVGKTWFALAMMLHGISGHKFLDRFDCHKAPWLYCDFDMHPDGQILTFRTKRLARNLGLENARNGYFLTRHHLPKAINLTTKDGFEAIANIISDHHIKVAVFEVFGTIHGAKNENDAALMDTAMSNLRELASTTGAALIVLHHTRKRQMGQEDDPASSGRGSSAIKARVDCLIDLRIKKQPGNGDDSPQSEPEIVVSHVKARHIKQLGDFRIRIADDPLLESTTIVCEGEGSRGKPSTSKFENWLLGTLWPEIEKSGLDRIWQSEVIDAAVESQICGKVTAIKGITSLQKSGLIVSTTAREPGEKGVKKWLSRPPETI